jgi:hypothetical protein
VNAHDRIMLGNGSGDGHSLVLGAEKVGVRGDFAAGRHASQHGTVPVGHLYFHGGASLAEAVVPVLVARLDTASQPSGGKVDGRAELQERRQAHHDAPAGHRRHADLLTTCSRKT